MDSALCKFTGLKPLQRKTVTYYGLATHALNTTEIFPQLAVSGPTSSGKSSTMKVAGVFAYQPHAFPIGNKTLPVIREELSKAHDGTAVIEEADESWKGEVGFESLLSGRYDRATAEAGFMEGGGAKGGKWTAVTRKTYGATILHRRKSFIDAALETRTIPIRTHKVDPKSVTRMPRKLSDDPILAEGYEFSKAAQAWEGGVELPAADSVPGIDGRVMDTFEPLLAMAKLLGDHAFIKEIKSVLLHRTEELGFAQETENEALVLRAILHHTHDERGRRSFNYVRLRAIADWIEDEFRTTIHPRQVGVLCRDLNLKTKSSNGAAVVVPDWRIIVRSCAEYGVTDDALPSKVAISSRSSGRVCVGRYLTDNHPLHLLKAKKARKRPEKGPKTMSFNLRDMAREEGN